jgi:signal transduction histidine kinase
VTHNFEHLGKRTMLVSGRRLLQDEGRPPAILLSIEDVTERKRKGDALERQVNELVADDRRKNEFLAMLAHELRNPLAPIKNAVEILRQKLADPPTAERARDMIDHQVGHMARLIDDLLDVSRITHGTIELKKEPVELSNILTEAAESMQQQVRSRDQELNVSLPQEPIYLEADAVRLEQIVTNLLSNASKFTNSRGHIWLTAEEVAPDGAGGAAPRSPEVIVRVRDDGIGIEPEMLPRIFNLFVQADNSLERKQQGLGIGLTLVKVLVEMHGGRITAQSSGAGKGAEFTVTLPILAEPPKSLHQSHEKSAFPARKRRILVVDDNRDAAVSLAMLLKLQGHDVDTAHDGEAAVSRAETMQPEIILLDIGLPQLNGYEVARKVRSTDWGRGMTLVALTGWGHDDDRKRSHDAGFDHHLLKPVDLDALEQILA